MGVATVGKVGRHEAGVCGIVGAVAGADIEGELDLAALVEALADFMLEVTAGGGSSGGNKSWHGRGNNTESVEGEGCFGRRRGQRCSCICRKGRDRRKGGCQRRIVGRQGRCAVGVGGDEGGICYVGPPAEAEPTVAEGSEGEGGADRVEGVGEWCESADDAEQGSVVGGLGAVEGWRATIDAAKEVGDAVLEGL